MSSSSRYLTKIGIENFRGIGGNFELTIPFHHGVVLLSGMNGLGKTSFFEAIEWALTGRVQRLERLSETSEPGKLELVYRYGGATSCNVSLSFSTDIDYADTDITGDTDNPDDIRLVERRFDQGKPSGLVSGTPTRDVVDILRAHPSWNVDAESLSTYLFLTHFHPQASRLRLIARSPEERWSWFSHLAGAERLSRARRNLTRAKGALTHKADDAKKLVAQARAALHAWAELLSRREQIDDRVKAAAALPPESIMLSLRELEFPVDHANAVPESLRVAQESTRQRIQQTQAQIDRLRSARELVSRWANNVNTLQRYKETQARVAEHIAHEVRARQKTDGDSDAAKRTLAACQQTEEASNTRVQLLARLKEAHSEYLRLRDLEPKLVTEVSQQESLVSRAIETLNRCTAGSEARSNTQRMLVKLEMEQSKLRDTLEQHSKFLLVQDQQKKRRSQRDQLQAKLDNNERNGKQTRAEGEAQAVVVKRCEDAVIMARKQAQELETALSIVAAHIADEERQCPVCKAEHPPRALKALANASAKASNASIATIEQQLAHERKRYSAIGSALQGMRTEWREVNAALKSTTAALGELDAEILRITNQLGTQLDDVAFVQNVAKRQTAIAREVAALSSQLRSLKTEEQSAVELRAAAALVSEAERTFREMRVRLESHRTAQTEAKARAAMLVDFGLRDDASSTDVVSLLQELVKEAEIARDARVRTEAALHPLVLEADRLRVSLDQREQEHASIARAIENLVSVNRDVEFQWKAFELGESPSMSVIEAVDAAAVLARDRAMDILRKLEELGKGLQTWLSFQELQDLDRRLSIEAEFRDISEHTAMLQNAVESALRGERDATLTRGLADQLGDVFKREVTAFNVDVLTPIRELFHSFVRVLVHDERLHAIQLESEIQARQGRLRVRLGSAGDDGPDAEMILSEGQIAEISIAALLAASTAYKWSTWQALLLDDPTQYNDLIRSTSLFETIRNLVYFEKYQVFLSTHDMQQANFFRRKLEGMNISCIDCRFLAQRDDSIHYQISESGDGP